MQQRLIQVELLHVKLPPYAGQAHHCCFQHESLVLGKQASDSNVYTHLQEGRYHMPTQ